MKLIIEDDEGRRTVVPLFRDELIIGRAEGSPVRLTEKDVSRRHAKLSSASTAAGSTDRAWSAKATSSRSASTISR